MVDHPRVWRGSGTRDLGHGPTLEHRRRVRAALSEDTSRKDTPVKRLLAVTLLTPVLAVGASVATAGSASAAGICINYDITVNGTQYAGAQCLPPA